MTFKTPSRTGVTTATQGTGTTIELGPAIEALYAFGSHPNSNENLTDGDTCPYVIVDGNSHEYGFGTFNTGTPNTFSRDQVTASTNGNNNRIDLSGNDAEVFVDIAGIDAISRDRNGRWKRNGATLYIPETEPTKTSDFTASVAKKYPTDTSSNTITCKLPGSPQQNDTVGLSDETGNWASKNLTIDGNGNNVNGASTYTCDLNGWSVTARYNGTQWIIEFGV